MSATDATKWQNVSAGPRQVKDLQRAIGALQREGKTHDELTGVIGGKEDRTSLWGPMGLVRAEVAALDEAIRAKYGHAVTRENVRQIIADYDAALPEARKSRRTEDNRRSAAQEAERTAAAAARDAEWNAKREAEGAMLAQVMAKAPRNAQALIYAEYREDASDPMTDYFNAITKRTVAIGWRTGSREDFRQLRAAAAQYPETAHMADEDTLKAWQVEHNGRAWGELEHRDNYSMGAGNYLSDHGGAHSGTGWIVKSAAFPCAYVQVTEDAIPGAPAKPETPARPVGTSDGRAVSGDVLDVLSRATADGNAVRLTDKLDRATYVAVAEVLKAHGGKWNRKAQATLFAGDAAPILAAILDGGTYRTAADDGWFATPPAVVARVLDAAALKPGMAVLEPSAGEGAIAGPVAAAGCEVDCVEYAEQRAAVIEAGGYARRVKVADFLTLDADPVYDRVLMNPPFAGKADIHHVTHALKFLRPGGRLVAIMAAGVDFRDDRLTAGFRATVDELGGTIEPLPDDAFKESGTGVGTVLVTLDAPPAAPAGRVVAATVKNHAGEPVAAYWAVTPDGGMTLHEDESGAYAHLVKASA
jgi:predicted RNA methylase